MATKVQIQKDKVVFSFFDEILLKWNSENESELLSINDFVINIILKSAFALLNFTLFLEVKQGINIFP